MLRNVHEHGCHLPAPIPRAQAKASAYSRYARVLLAFQRCLLRSRTCVRCGLAAQNGAPANGVRRAPLRQILAAMGAGTQLLLPLIEEGSTEHPWLLLADLSSGLLAQTIRCVCLACQPTSQQYYSLILNQHQPPATSQSAVLFSHNKSAPAISHSQTNTAIETRNHG